MTGSESRTAGILRPTVGNELFSLELITTMSSMKTLTDFQRLVRWERREK